MSKIHVANSVLGHLYRDWRQSSDRGNWQSPLLAYAAVNDLDEETVEKLRAWEADGFPEVPR